MNEQMIAFVVALLCSGALVTVYILWLAGLFSNRSKPQSVYDAIVTDAMVLGKVEDWLEEEIQCNQDHVDAYASGKTQISINGDVFLGRHECAEGLQDMINKWRNELDITVTK